MHARAVVVALVALAAAALVTPGRAGARTELPVSLEGNAIVFTPRLAGGAPMRILLDSGGYDLIEPGAVARLALATTPMKLGTADRATVAFPPFRSDAAIPVPATRWLVARPNVFTGTFALDLDATLGASWFLDHTVTVDYPHRTAALPDAAPAGATRVPLVVAQSPPLPGLPPEALALVDVTVAGETLTMLLDTGATARIGAALRARMPDAAPVRQICFADAAVVARWHAAHPDWDYAATGAQVPEDDGLRTAPMIRVPAVTVAGRPSPPTWFLARPDDNFAQLSRRLQRTVAGDLGGDALRAWRVTFDLGKEQMFLE
jgi:hypothetical protein